MQNYRPWSNLLKTRLSRQDPTRETKYMEYINHPLT